MVLQRFFCNCAMTEIQCGYDFSTLLIVAFPVVSLLAASKMATVQSNKNNHKLTLKF